MEEGTDFPFAWWFTVLGGGAVYLLYLTSTDVMTGLICTDVFIFPDFIYFT